MMLCIVAASPWKVGHRHGALFFIAGEAFAASCGGEGHAPRQHPAAIDGPRRFIVRDQAEVPALTLLITDDGSDVDGLARAASGTNRSSEKKYVIDTPYTLERTRSLLASAVLGGQ